MARHPEQRTIRRLVRTAVAASLIASAVLTGCSPSPAPTAAGPTPGSAAPTPTATPEPSEQPLTAADPEASAERNLDLFRRVVEEVWAGEDRTAGRAYVDALVAAGFPKDRMEVTRDTTTVGNPAESIQFAVLWGRECLVGQVGPATGSPVATVLPALLEGGCLVGRTRPIDW